ncbi:hypothetical protein XCR1_2810008 [Xenorhabdus cabanillasii JM26]|uniref:Uncharacterized protein n=1 Tax=Xenorhabdus cabanillasii JM26 TaxID=1427517 RepID=W1J8I9_9GAMM|nr:hypothetical protein XCR1_2810008 [Xenorhabdus cabanillasii JM26]
MSFKKRPLNYFINDINNYHIKQIKLSTCKLNPIRNSGFA